MDESELIGTADACRMFSISDKVLQRLVATDAVLVRGGSANHLLYCPKEVSRAVEKMTGGLPVATPEMGELLTLSKLRKLLRRRREILDAWVRSGALKPVARDPKAWSYVLYRVAEAKELSAKYESQRGKCQPTSVSSAQRRNRPLPPEPTDIPPGPGRVAVYEWRQKNGYSLYHPQDAKADVT